MRGARCAPRKNRLRAHYTRTTGLQLVLKSSRHNPIIKRYTKIVVFLVMSVCLLQDILYTRMILHGRMMFSSISVHLSRVATSSSQGSGSSVENG